jgi:16S rRNA C967 or C1407 C5-methylase (RsmB/RsmF family)
MVYNLDARNASQLNIKFNRVLLDVPCSGNFAADPEWFQHRTLHDVERNAGVQREIIAEAAKILSDDGEIVYSTCSLEPEEDELNMDWAIKHLPLQIEAMNSHEKKGLTTIFGKQLDPSVERCRRIWPSETQGFFTCKLKRRNT